MTHKGGQFEGPSNPPNPQNPPELPEGEPRVDLGDQEMDVEAMRNMMAAMQVDMNNLRSSHDVITQTVTLQQQEMERQRREMANQQVDVLRRQTEAATSMDVALRLAREAQEAPPQQHSPLNSASTTHEERTRTRALSYRAASCTEVPPARSARKEDPSQREGQPARSPRRNVTDDQDKEGRTNIKDAMMMLIMREISRARGSEMGMTDTKENPATTKMLLTIDKPRVLTTEGILRGNNKKSLIINDPLHRVPGEAQEQWSV